MLLGGDLLLVRVIDILHAGVSPVPPVSWLSRLRPI
jgi:hypothetical protein